jgi:Tetratricopeptide repeat
VDGDSTQVRPGHARRQLADRLVLARAQQSRGDLDAALHTLTRILADGRDLGGATVLTARRMHAEIHLDKHHTGYAHELARALFDDCAARLGAAHPATIRAGCLLAATYHRLGDLDAAEGLCQQVIATADPRRAPGRRALLLSRVRLALVTADRADQGAAVDALTRAFDEFRDRYGDADLDALRIAARLADLCASTGDLAAARRVLTRAHHAATGRLGPAHPLTATLDALLLRMEPPMPAAAHTSDGGPHRGASAWRRWWSRRSRTTRATATPSAEPPAPASAEPPDPPPAEPPAIPEQRPARPAGARPAGPWELPPRQRSAPRQRGPDTHAPLPVTAPAPTWAHPARATPIPAAPLLSAAPGGPLPGAHPPPGAPPARSLPSEPGLGAPSSDPVPDGRVPGVAPGAPQPALPVPVPAPQRPGRNPLDTQPPAATGQRVDPPHQHWYPDGPVFLTPPAAPLPRLTREGPPPRRRGLPRRGLPLWGLLAAAVVASGAAVDIGAHHLPGGRVPASTSTAASPTAAPDRPAGPFQAEQLLVQNGATPDGLTVTWFDPSGGTATPVVAIATATGQTVAVATLPPGTSSYAPHGLDPAADYCALVALYADPTDTSAVATRACLHRPHT